MLNQDRIRLQLKVNVVSNKKGPKNKGTKNAEKPS